MLEVKNITKKFGDFVAVDNISFKVNTGSILGILGRNGAGKSTIFRSILNVYDIDSGEILFNSKKINNKLTNDIGYLIEEGCLTPEYTVYNQFQTFGILKDMKDEDIEKELIYWLNRFNIIEYLNKKVKDISKGNRQKLQFIVSILHKPKLLILDEPFSGLDPVSILEFKEIILELKKLGTTIIFSSHRMEHIEMLCDDILFIHKGKELLYGNLKEIKENYDLKKIVVSGKLNNFNDEKIIKIENNRKDVYELFVKNDNVDNITKELKNLGNLNYNIEDLDLEDIFIDKVGVKYEE